MTSSVPKGLCRYEPALEQPLVDFLHEAYPERPSELLAPRWTWMFLESAQRLGVEPMVWLYVKDGRVQAHQGAIPVRCKIGDQQRVAGWFVETMALESVRGRAVGSMVIQKALEDMPFNLSLGQTEQMRAIQLAMGWETIGPLRTYALPIDPSAILRAKFRLRMLVPLLAGGVKLSQVVRRSVRRPGAAGDYEAKPLPHFGDDYDRLWGRVREQLRCTTERDASFMNWKFVDQPGQDIQRIAVHCRGELAGVAVMVLRNPDDNYAYRRALMLDLIVPATDRLATWALLNAVVDTCRAAKAAVIMCDITCPPLERELSAYGFLRREPTRVFLLATAGLDEDAKQLARKPQNWFLSRADSDIDRPG
ncbi:MAG: hypothetical protein OES79_15600 [Planctomycetota bacterium]|nr:hypothetical protein [Planctomycetota bacterium]